MPNLVNMKKISLKNNSNIKESMIQDFIFKNPQILGLGDLIPIQREISQPSGGILDLLLDDDNGTRYEVEIQLGATDPSHIIRTIEYWDIERKRYPQYEHCAVIIAEDITNRFFNVISLFNGSIPIIAIQLSAYENNDNISLAFTKVIDRVELGKYYEENNQEITDRNYWETRSSFKMLKNVDDIFSDIKEFAQGFELKYNKYYIGLSKDGRANNFIFFKPKKSFLYLIIRGNENNEKIKVIEESGLEIQYNSRLKRYEIRFNNIEDYRKNKNVINELVKSAMEYYEIV